MHPTSLLKDTDKIRDLWNVAEQWLGTPWCANSQACGPRGGVSCHNLPRAILMECGILPPDFPEIRGDPTDGRHNCKSIIEPWLDARPEFSRLKTQDLRPETLAPGDLLGLRIYRCIDHLGLYLGSATQDSKLETRDFVHVLMHKRTGIDSLADPTWSSRLVAVWRPGHLRFTKYDLRDETAGDIAREFNRHPVDHEKNISL